MGKVKIDLIVSRHKGLIDYLKEHGYDDVPVIEHATPDDVRHKVVLGNLPLYLASLADAVITPQLEIPPELRGKDLSKEEFVKYLKGFKVYAVLFKGIIKL